MGGISELCEIRRRAHPEGRPDYATKARLGIDPDPNVISRLLAVSLHLAGKRATDKRATESNREQPKQRATES